MGYNLLRVKRMFKFWTQSSKYLSFRQAGLAVGLMVATVCQGQTTPTASLISRGPASYIPDDDVIIKPVDNELSFYQQYVKSDKSELVIQSRNQMKIWSDNQTFADQYGMDSTLTGSSFFVPTPEEKWDYFQDRYLRYLRRQGEAPLKAMPKDWYQDYRASNRVDTIDEMEGRFRATQRKGVSGKNLPDSLQAKEVSVWKQTKFIFQPRVDQGLVIVGFRSPIAYARAWVGVNGRTEFNVQQTYEKTGTRFMFNYEADTKKHFISIDQQISGPLYARFTSNKNPQHDAETAYQDDTLMLLYAKQF